MDPAVVKRYRERAAVSAIPPQAMPVSLPKQITYPNVAIDVQPLPDGNRVLVIQSPAGAPTEVLLFPMDAKYADALGRKLTAPHIVTANGHGPPQGESFR